jgi:hypothetical protein
MRRLRDKMREDLALRGMSENTIVTYLGLSILHILLLIGGRPE